MPYIGKQAAAGQTETVKDSFNGDNSTTAFTMSQSVGLDTDIEVFVGNVQQEPGSGKAYTVSGTTLTFSEAPPTGTANIYVIHRNSLQGTLLPPQNLGDRNYLIGGDLSLDADGAAVKFGVDSEITLTHSADSGLLLKHAASGDDKFPTLTLQTGDTDIAQNDILGTVAFQAPDEGTGTDAILVAASIQARSEGDFSSSSNATELVFNTGASEAAANKMKLGSGGDLSLVVDGASIFFGADSEIELRHVADDGLILKHVGTGDGKEPSLTFQAGDNDIAQDDVLGQINFQAPDEGAGTDAVLVASTIKAFSEGDFSSSNNATTLELATGRSAAAGSDGGRLRLTSAGVLELKSQNTADGSKPVFHLQAGDTDIAQDDELGVISFSAPDEGAGTDAILIAAQITAVSEGDFSSSSNATSLLFKTGASEAAAEKMRLTSGGELVINDTASRSVNSALHKLQVSHTDYNCISAITYKAGADGAVLTLGKSRNGTIGSNTIVQDNDALGSLTFVGADGTDLVTQGARISAEVDGTPGANDLPTRLVFSTTADGASSVSERMRIQSDGKIGIGINDVKMDVGGIHLGDDRGIGFGDGNSTRSDFQLVYQSSNTRLGLICGTGANTEDVIFTTSGKQHIGTTNSTSRLSIGFSHSTGEEGIRITPDATTATMIRFDNSGGTQVGSITSGGGSTAFNTSSDYRLKENVSYNWDAITRLKQLKPARFNWIDDDTNTLLDGFIAHEVSSIVPESITGDKDATQDIGSVKNSEGKVIQENVPKSVVEEQNGETWTKTGTENVYQSIDQSKLVPLLVKALQEAVTKIETLETSNADLITRVKTLEDA